MKRRFLMIILSLLTSIWVVAQTDLSGRKYHRDFDIISDLQIISDYSKVIPDTNKSAMTVSEKEWTKSLEVINKAIVAYVTVRFTDARTLKFSVVMRYDDSRAMAGGASLLMRDLMKRTFTNVSRTEKADYIVNGHTIIAQNKKMMKKGETLTFELSDNGETLIYINNPYRVPLPRTK